MMKHPICTFLLSTGCRCGRRVASVSPAVSVGSAWWWKSSVPLHPCKETGSTAFQLSPSLPWGRLRGIIEPSGAAPVVWAAAVGNHGVWSCRESELCGGCRLAEPPQESLPVCHDSFKLLIPLRLPAFTPPSSLPCYFSF